MGNSANPPPPPLHLSGIFNCTCSQGWAFAFYRLGTGNLLMAKKLNIYQNDKCLTNAGGGGAWAPMELIETLVKS